MSVAIKFSYACVLDQIPYFNDPILRSALQSLIGQCNYTINYAIVSSFQRLYARAIVKIPNCSFIP